MDDVFELKESPAARFEELSAPRTSDRIFGYREEIAQYYTLMNRLTEVDVTLAFQSLSTFSARASEMRSQVVTVSSRQSERFRIDVIDPFLNECDRQFKVLSRIQAIREMEVRLAGGAFT